MPSRVSLELSGVRIFVNFGGDRKRRRLIKSERKQRAIGTVTVAFDRILGRMSYPVHNRIYRLSKGRIGYRSPAGPMLLLTSTGHRTGVSRTHALLYLVRDGLYYVVASNGGRSSDPHWLFNIRHDPNVKVQAGSRKFDAMAHVLDTKERSVMWPILTTFYPGWSHYETLTSRNLQVVRLDPKV
jgi:F420H(2)-dependent quinone reductase